MGVGSASAATLDSAQAQPVVKAQMKTGNLFPTLVKEYMQI
ncbi:hypothetical protein [Brevibacillus laterosporus]